MLAPKSLSKPLNWQDFETLCKRLWREIWGCAEISRNGRTGQAQNGVDIYGIPTGQREYFGIQCKGKDEYTNKQFSRQELIREIEKAKSFKPALKKLYFATTANKDVAIEEFVRTQNLSHIEQGLFEIHLFCWEDIAELIGENRDTYNWYLGNCNFKDLTSIKISFEDGQDNAILRPRFRQKRIVYSKKEGNGLSKEMLRSLGPMWQPGSNLSRMITALPAVSKPRRGVVVNQSYCKFNLVISNIGTEALENYKLSFSLDGDILDLSKTNFKNDILVIYPINREVLKHTHINPENRSGDIAPTGVLVGDDCFISSNIYIKPAPVEGEIILHWKLISSSFRSAGKLIIQVIPEIETVHKYVKVNEEEQERIEWEDIEDLLEEKD